MMTSDRWSGDGRRKSIVAFTPTADTHAGLRLDKLLRVLNPQSDDDKKAIRDLIRGAASTLIPEGYKEAFQRREVMLRTLNGGVEGGVTMIWEAEAKGRLVVGLGSESLRETNMTLEHCWGVPIIPGSALKGVTSYFAHHNGGQSWRAPVNESPIGEDYKLLFGDTTSAGFVTFHDAWWIPEKSSLPLDLDIMTVHHADYYGGKDFSPADWDEPNPVAFMTTQGKFLIALSGPRGWVERAGELLSKALELNGVGGKTRAGYGRLSMKRKLSDEEMHLEGLRRKLAGLPGQHQGNQTARQHIKELKNILEQGLDEADVKLVAKKLWEREPKFWKSWYKEKANDDERVFIDRLGLRDVAPARPQPENPTSQPAAIPKNKEERVLDGVAWIAKDKKNKRIAYFVGGGLSIERESKDVKPEESLREDLEAAGCLENAISVVATVTGEGKKAKLLNLKRH